MMPFDIKANAPSMSLTPLITLRWMAVFSQLLAVMAAEAVFGITVYYPPLLFLIFASVAVNLVAVKTFERRQAPEEVMRLHLVFDILQFSGFLYFTGGVENPFSILLLAPLAMGASLLSLFSLCLLIIETIICLAVMSYGAVPLVWKDGQPELPPQYAHAQWAGMLATLVVISFIIWRLAMENRRTNTALQKTHAILEEKRRITALGALAAASVHELGSPLGTILLVVKELEREITPDDPIADDIAILKSESEKCKRILAEIARNPVKSIRTPENLRLDRLIMETASEHGVKGRAIEVTVRCPEPENLPFLPKNANLLYGLGNFIGNAISFANRHVYIDVEGLSETIEVVIRDDGPGFPPSVLKRLGEPYISTRTGEDEHMGLGVFIAINLLEATGAALFFENHPEGGAKIHVIWPRSALDALVAKA